ncbi:MAG: hypothetical protein EBZ47_00235 [Chlamydiae bacterium]|nr:hypothetical protein [Chlamydiota bacterium]
MYLSVAIIVKKNRLPFRFYPLGITEKEALNENEALFYWMIVYLFFEKKGVKKRIDVQFWK